MCDVSQSCINFPPRLNHLKIATLVPPAYVAKSKSGSFSQLVSGADCCVLRFNWVCGPSLEEMSRRVGYSRGCLSIIAPVLRIVILCYVGVQKKIPSLCLFSFLLLVVFFFFFPSLLSVLYLLLTWSLSLGTGVCSFFIYPDFHYWDKK
jgi:hypothetical protein